MPKAKKYQKEILNAFLSQEQLFNKKKKVNFKLTLRSTQKSTLRSGPRSNLRPPGHIGRVGHTQKIKGKEGGGLQLGRV